MLILSSIRQLNRCLRSLIRCPGVLENYCLWTASWPRPFNIESPSPLGSNLVSDIFFSHQPLTKRLVKLFFSPTPSITTYQIKLSWTASVRGCLAQKLTLPFNILTPLNFSRSPHILPSLPPPRILLSDCGAKEGGSGDKDDGFYMRRCVELARKAIGCTSPDPMVGCVIVKTGQPHAEVFALRDAGDLAENATAYVSLEPCNHYGRTPPCSEAMVKAKLKKVVIGMIDPNPIVASRGEQRLRDAGIDVVVGVEKELCKRLIEAFIHKIYSLSAIGNLLNQLGEGVTGSGGYYSQFCTFCLVDCQFPIPYITRTWCQSTPLDSNGRALVLQSKFILTENAASRVIIFTDKEATEEPETAKKGIETVVLDQINLNRILEL
ncbi:hypothetical protein NC652_032845 [Populus alba x Populus x berolinensis]|nr:hypothetical protein NC652_032845 [Populus alba x Populus x berolinensis]